jgi:hypothetical protein
MATPRAASPISYAGGPVTLLERDILAVLLAVNTVFVILILPNVVPIDYSANAQALLFTTLAWGLPLGAVGIAVNHRTATAGDRRQETGPTRRR